MFLEVVPENEATVAELDSGGDMSSASDHDLAPIYTVWERVAGRVACSRTAVRWSFIAPLWYESKAPLYNRLLVD